MPARLEVRTLFNIHIVLLWYGLFGHRASGFEYQLVEQDPEGLYGVLQVKRSDAWGTVCAQKYDESDAKVICRSLNLPESDARALERPYGAGTRNVTVASLHCTGRELTLAECPGVNQTVTGCPTNMTVLVYCAKAWADKFRLIGDGMLSSGLAQVFHQGEWGTIQTTYTVDKKILARVICRSLGFPYVISLSQSRNILLLDGPMWMKIEDCSGIENSLLDCPHKILPRRHPHDNMLDFRAKCEGIRSRTGEGLTVFHQDEWRPVFSEDFNDLAATVACRSMGQPRSGARVLEVTPNPAGDKQLVLDVGQCRGDEYHLLYCSGDHWVKRTPGIINVECAHMDTSNMKFQLVATQSPFVGRLEVSQGDDLRFTGTVCGYKVSQATVKVACRTLGLPSAFARLARTDIVGKGNGNIVLHDLSCRGNESSLADCYYNPLGVGSCSYWSDLCLYCGPEPLSEDYRLRLIGGEDANSGRVEMYMYGIWNQLCEHDSHPNIHTAHHVCRQLNLPSSAVKVTNCFDGGTNRFWPFAFLCISGQSLEDCSTSPKRSKNCKPLRVICSDADVDDSDCFATEAWVYVLIGIGVLVSLIIGYIVFRSWKARRRRMENSQRNPSTQVQCTLADADANVELNVPKPYSDSPPSYGDVMGKPTST